MITNATEVTKCKNIFHATFFFLFFFYICLAAAIHMKTITCRWIQTFYLSLPLFFLFCANLLGSSVFRSARFVFVSPCALEPSSAKRTISNLDRCRRIHGYVKLVPRKQPFRSRVYPVNALEAREISSNCGGNEQLRLKY